MTRQVFLAAIFVFCSILTTASAYNVVCYFSSWAIYRNLNGKFDVSNIDPNLCTHVNFAFVELYEDGSIFIVDPWESNDSSEGGHYNGFRNLANLKRYNPQLKVSISLGGWNEGSKNFSIVSADSSKRQKLISQCLDLINKYSFDGIDIDWEYPTLRNDSHPEDKQNFLELIKDFSTVFKPKGLLVTAAVAGAVEKIEAAYHVKELSNYLDLLNIMTYDYHGAFDDYVGHVSPLHASPLDFEHGRNSTYTVATALEYWLYKGADPSKIILGISTYGRTFTLENKSNTQLYAPVLGAGDKGPYTALPGSLSYNEICERYSGSDSVYYWDDDQKVPHRVLNDQWIGFDDERSIQLKVDFAVSKGIGGVMLWALEGDDFLGICGTKYALTLAAKNRLEYWKSNQITN